MPAAHQQAVQRVLGQPAAGSLRCGLANNIDGDRSGIRIGTGRIAPFRHKCSATGRELSVLSIPNILWDKALDSFAPFVSI